MELKTKIDYFDPINLIGREEIYKENEYFITETILGKFKGVFEFWKKRKDSCHPEYLGSMGDHNIGFISVRLKESINAGELPENIIILIKFWSI